MKRYYEAREDSAVEGVVPSNTIRDPIYTKAKTKPISSRMRIVKPGENLSLIAGQTYGSLNEKYVEWVKKHNPHIVNPDFILPGQYIVLPEYQ